MPKARLELARFVSNPRILSPVRLPNSATRAKVKTCLLLLFPHRIAKMEADQEKAEFKSSTSPSLGQTLKEVFQESIRSVPWVFRRVSLQFAVYWIPFIIVVIVLINQVPAFSNSPIMKSIFITGLHFLDKCFIIFLVPYLVYAFLNQNQKESIPKFKNFVAENIFPLVINHIKAAFVILAYLLLLIVPGVIKAIRLAFVTQATFFDEEFKSGGSALKASQKTVKGSFFTIVCLMLFVGVVVYFLISKGLFLLIPLERGHLVRDILDYIYQFYAGAFASLLMTQAYFILKRLKG